MIIYSLLIAYTFHLINAIPVPNGQLGSAEVECGDTTIEVVFLTEDTFKGRIFVIGHANDSRCSSRDTGRRTTSIIINKNECGVITTRSINPPGLFSSVKVMISFHNDFITKVDRAVASFNELAQMPRCRYEVINPQTKETADVVTVGSKLLHRWICESTTPDLWCMTVHSCHVEDDAGTTFSILDERGCSIDRYLLDNIEYGPGALQAQKEAHAFKFADKVVVNFQCSVRIDIRDGECPIPNCAEPIERQRLRPRSAGYIREFPLLQNGSVELDVRAQQFDVLDPQIGQTLQQHKQKDENLNDNYKTNGFSKNPPLFPLLFTEEEQQASVAYG
ncbi:unnamed protein product [Angiostrongylus costaricensis]|uniref:ZP domain-containing protein n=1 Tax=Angiostrongylus costaricensis TaxID=334426 RepID=A0A158PKA1_ANGCS|nr:unnamed protein product [Angiostrongylus costaricensis]